jgi:hypothetical protein
MMLIYHFLMAGNIGGLYWLVKGYLAGLETGHAEESVFRYNRNCFLKRIMQLKDTFSFLIAKNRF